MIESLHIPLSSNVEIAVAPYAKDLPFLQQCGGVVEFKPGLNILIGKNGSGKSTILRLLANALAAAQGGYSCITQTWLSAMNFNHGGPNFSVKHDGRAIEYLDTQATVGLSGGGFDYDFMHSGIDNTIRKGSTGQHVMAKGGQVLENLLATTAQHEKAWAKYHAAVAARDRKKSDRFCRPGPMPPAPRIPLDYSIQAKCVVPNAASKYLSATIPDTGVRTFLLDEADASLSFEVQHALWTHLKRVDFTRRQVIVASHSPWALNIKGARYIELDPNMISYTNVLIRLLHLSLDQEAQAEPDKPKRKRTATKNAKG